MLHRRPLIALVAALMLWAASLKAFLTGGIDLTTAGIRFLISFIVAWVGVTIFGLVVAGYGKETTTRLPRRRRTDAGEPGGERVGVDDG